MDNLLESCSKRTWLDSNTLFKTSTYDLKAIPQSHMLRLRFAAFYETQPIEITNVYLSDSHNHYRLFFQGQEKVTLKPQDACWSDGIDIHEMDQSELRLDYDIVVSPDYHFVSGFERMDYDVFKEAPQQFML